MSLPSQALVLVLAVRGYRLLLSPWLGSHCRFTPSCSTYAIEALETHGAAAGSYLAGRRLLRCHPGCAGGIDPVPSVFTGPFSAFHKGKSGAPPSSDSSDDRRRAGMAP